jgi:cytochrome b involved in lipid metabolism
MFSRFLLGGTLIVLLGAIGVAYFMMPQNQPVTVTTEPAGITTNPTGTIVTSGNSTTTQSGYTMAKVAQHNNASSCWAAINGNVYDLTAWINQHPGGPERILSICGTDGSAAFNGQHAGQSQPANILKNFLLGPLSS